MRKPGHPARLAMGRCGSATFSPRKWNIPWRVAWPATPPSKHPMNARVAMKSGISGWQAGSCSAHRDGGGGQCDRKAKGPWHTSLAAPRLRCRLWRMTVWKGRWRGALGAGMVKLVEAVGIEPTSEKVQQSKTTCVSASKVSADGLEAARSRQPSLVDLGLPPQAAGFSPAHSMTFRWLPVGLQPGTRC